MRRSGAGDRQYFFYFLLLRVLSQFLGRAPRVGQARGPALRPRESFVYPPLRTATSPAQYFMGATVYIYVVIRKG